MDGRRGAGARFLGDSTRRLQLTLLVALLAGFAGCGGRHRVVPHSGETSGDNEPTGQTSASAHEASRIIPGAPLLIRVGLATDLTVVTLTVRGPTRLLAGDRRREVASLLKDDQLAVRSTGNRLHWQTAGRTGDADLVFLAPRDPAHLLNWNEAPYRGEILLRSVGGKVTIINVVELETYLRGVVPWEIGRPGPEALAAVEAQAVAARTYTISHLRERDEFGFDVWADVQDQVYRGAYGEDAVCDEAITRTSGLVLRAGHREIEAYYSSTCGGWTSNLEEVWPRPAQSYLRSHRDAIGGGPPFCAAARHFSWEVSWTRTELERTLAQTLQDYIAYMSNGSRAEWAGRLFTPRSAAASPNQPGRLRDLKIISRTTSGRVGRLDIVTDAGVYHVRGDRVRWVLVPLGGDPVILRSALFELTVMRDGEGLPLRITAAGRGFGHGVGMCQEGALAMARQGDSNESILKHYYAGTRLESFEAVAP